MKRKTAALYDPYFDIMGGGERHILSILQVLENEGYDVSVFWDTDLSKEIKDRLNLSFKNLRFTPGIFSRSAIGKLKVLHDYELFLYVTDGSYFLSSAKKNFVFCMVPDRKLYRMTPLNRVKTFNYRFISNSLYTKHWLRKWHVQSEVIYPYVSDDLLATDITGVKKDKIILAVGRFFPHLHAKKYEEILETFNAFQKKYPDFTLVLAGGVKKEDMNYFEGVKKMAETQGNVIIKPNISYTDLVRLYHSSMFFWHFAGYGIDENKNPDRVEHLGMTPLEAMAAGAVPFCYRAGGPKEIITDGENGYLFLTQPELLEKMEHVVLKKEQYGKIQKNAQQTVRDKFSYNTFRDRVNNVLLKQP